MTQLSFESLLRREYYSVTEFTREVKSVLEREFDQVWVQGEISNFVHHSSGHMYFSLKDKNAQISCVMWRSRNEWLYFMPDNGMKIVVNARLSLYEKRGNYQLDVWQMIPSGAGELQIAFEQLKARLQDEGLFDEQYKKPLPKFPERIGIITSPTGAAIQDLLAVLHRRFPAIQVVLNPVRVQGDGAASEIAQAIDEFNEYGKMDILIVGRGGGSLEDLWAFNEEIVARAVFRSEIPIVSAVGHEIDYTICDFVADLRAPTPSAAAELAVPDKSELEVTLNGFSNKMTQSVLDFVKYYQERIETIKKSYAFRQPENLVFQHAQRLDETRRHLDKNISHKLELSQADFAGLSRRLSLLEHKNILKRGYSLCYRRSDGKLIRRAKELSRGAGVELDFYEGKALGKVEEVIS